MQRQEPRAAQNPNAETLKIVQEETPDPLEEVIYNNEKHRKKLYLDTQLHVEILYFTVLLLLSKNVCYPSLVIPVPRRVNCDNIDGWKKR